MTGPKAYVCCADAKAAIEFYCKAFAAEVVERFVDRDGRIGHAELSLGGGSLMLADPYPEAGFAPAAAGPTRAFQLYLTVKDIEAAFQRAVDAGATAVQAPETDAHGRRCKLTDPSGILWCLGEAKR